MVRFLATLKDSGAIIWEQGALPESLKCPQAKCSGNRANSANLGERNADDNDNNSDGSADMVMFSGLMDHCPSCSVDNVQGHFSDFW